MQRKRRRRRRRRRSQEDIALDKYYTPIQHPRGWFHDAHTTNAKLALYNPLEDQNLKSFYKVRIF